MSDESLMLAREVVIRYHVHGFRTKVENDALFVWRESGWEGPLDASALWNQQDDEIARIEGDARVAVVAALAREVDRRRRGVVTSVSFRQFTGMIDTMLHSPGFLRTILSKAGWDEARAELYAGVAASLHDRGELLRESLD